MIITDEGGVKWEVTGTLHKKGGMFLSAPGPVQCVVSGSGLCEWPGSGIVKVAPVTVGGVVFEYTGEFRRAGEGDWIFLWGNLSCWRSEYISTVSYRILRPIKIIDPEAL